MLIRSALPLLVLFALSRVTTADDKKADTRPLALRTADALYDGVTTAELPNGLRVFLKPVPGAASVTTLVVYKVGSADEEKTFTGLSHYLEHLMFKGTATLKPGDIDRITYRAGGSNNAYTSTDLTAYHFNLPAGRWEAALQVEADRMRNLRIDKEHEFDKEKGAVISELAGGEDEPWDLEYKSLLPRLFGKQHPYGHPVIGEEQHVKDATEKVIKAHYDRWYHPNNAVLVMVGGFEPEAALKAIKKLFGDIPRGKLPERKAVPAEGPALPARHQFTSKFSVARVMIGYPSVKKGDADDAALTVLAAVLGSGKRSRLYRELVDKTGVASSASADHSPGRYPGWFGLYMEVMPGHKPEEAEKKLLAEVAKLRDARVDEAELKRVKQLLVASAVFGRESTNGLARAIGEAVTIEGSLDAAKKALPRLMAVTAEDVQRVARKYLDAKRSATVWSVPAAKDKGKGAGASPAPALKGRAIRERGAGGEGGFDLKKTQRHVLDNGLTVLLFENRRLPIVQAQLMLRDSNVLQPDDKLGVAALTGALLDEGTATRSAEQIAEAIESVGGSLSFSGGGGSVKVLSPERKLGLGLLFDSLIRPSFPKDAFALAKARQLSEVEENETQPAVKARQAYAAAVYGSHPLGRPSAGTPKTVKGLTRDDVAAFHKKTFVPNNAILAVVGDFDSKEMLALIKDLTGGWKKAELKRPAMPQVDKPAKFTQKIITMPEAAQVNFYMGHVGIKRDNPDYYKLLVMDHVLGTGPGFTDRLSARLRDREGLAYTVTARIAASAGEEPGAFTAYIGTNAANFARARQLFLEEIKRIRDEKPTDEEVADARTYLTGSALLDYATNAGIAAGLLEVERYGLGLDHLEKFDKAIKAVTPADVQAVARKYLDPSRMVIVAAGALDEGGKPLKPR